jgi:hypothetical protein
MITKIYSLFAILALSVTAWSQGVGINETGNNPDPSAILDVESTDKGFLPPRMTAAQRDAISSPANGLVVYNTDADCLQTNNGTSAAPIWECLGVVQSAIVVTTSTPTYTGQNVIVDNLTGNHQITLPNPASAQYSGKIIFFRNNSSAAGTPGTATFITYTPVVNSTCLANRGMVLYSNGTNWFVVGGL